MTDRGLMSHARRIRLGLVVVVAGMLAAGLVIASPRSAEAVSFPAITSISPSQGPTRGGTTITVTGMDFQVGANLFIGGFPAIGVTRVSDTQITGTTPPSDSGTGRAATVMVTNPDGAVATLTSAFFYATSEAPLAISGVTASTGPNSGGTSMTITGAGFSSAAAVFFGDLPGVGINVLGGSAIFARTPPGVTGSVAVTVVNPDGARVSLPNGFTFVGDISVATSIPGGGPLVGGSTIRVDGNGFARGATVKIGDVPVTSVTYVNSTQLVLVTPPGAVGPKSLTVTNPDGRSATTPQGFTYGPQPNSVTPVVSGLSPANGQSLGGTQVTVNGTGFSGGAMVYFGNVPSPSVSWNGASSLFVRTPSNLPGPVAVRVVNNDGATATLASGFTYEGTAGLTLSNASPATASSAGGAITINGNGINPGSWVTFNGVTAPSSTVIGSTQIVATVPPGLSGTVTVAVTQIGDVSATLPGGLTVTGSTTPPVITPPVTTPPVTTPPVAGGTGAFLVAPIFSTLGQALVIFGGGTVAQLEVAASAATAKGAWVQDPTGAYQLLVVGGPAFLKEQFQAKFAAGIAVNTPMALTR